MMKKVKTFIALFKEVHQLNPRLFPYQIALAIVWLLRSLSAVFVPAYIISVLSSGTDFSGIMVPVVLVLFGVLIIAVIAQFLQQKVSVEVSTLEGLFNASVSKRMMEIPYHLVEDPVFITKKDVAIAPMVQYGTLYFCFDSIPRMMQATLTIITLSAIVVNLNPWVFVMVFGLTLISSLLNTWMTKEEAKQAKTSPRSNRIYSYYLRSMRDIQIAKDVRIYSMHHLLIKKIHALFTSYIESGTLLYQAIDKRGLVNRVSSVILQIAMYGFMLSELMTGSLDIATFILYVNASLSFSDQLFLLMNELITFNKHYEYIREYVGFGELLEKSMPLGSKILNEEIETVTFENVSFRYPGGEKDVLNNVSMVLDSKKSYAVVGQNGSGKTTMIKLIARLYQPTQGRILVNGIDINDYDLTSYQTKLSITFQDFKVFNTTIRENISFTDNDEMRMDDAVEKAELVKELFKFPNGLDTLISSDAREGSISLSKGQEQKIAIARSVYRDGSLMILDEPTASLDPIAEEEVYRHFRKITADKLTVFISHRLSSCRFSDEILYLKNGSIYERGDHDTLMNLKGEYEAMFTLQGSQYQ